MIKNFSVQFSALWKYQEVFEINNDTGEKNKIKNNAMHKGIWD